MSTINVHIFVSFNCIPSMPAYLNSPMFIPLTAPHDCTQCPHPMSISDDHLQCMDLMLVLLPTLLSEPNQCSDPMITPNDVPTSNACIQHSHPMSAPSPNSQCCPLSYTLFTLNAYTESSLPCFHPTPNGFFHSRISLVNYSSSHSRF